MVFAAKDLLTFDELISTPIDFSNIEECFKALTDKLDRNNLEGDRCPFDLTNHLPLKGRPGRLTIAAEYYFNNDLEFLKSSDPKKKYTTSITKTKAARVSVKKLHGYGHLEEITVRRADCQVYKFKEGDFIDINLNGIEDVLLLTVQHKLFQLDGSNIVDLIVALCMFTRSLIIKICVEDLQLGVESYQKKLSINELYTPSYKPPWVIYEDLNKQKRLMRADELYKFSDRTLKTVRDELHHRILNFSLGYNKEINRRMWSVVDRRRLELMVKLIDKKMQER
ncbi:hypothetical protein Tco_1172836 [Tanacetum coccineum]